jgi:hypothetical protein
MTSITGLYWPTRAHHQSPLRRKSLFNGHQLGEGGSILIGSFADFAQRQTRRAKAVVIITESSSRSEEYPASYSF